MDDENADTKTAEVVTESKETVNTTVDPKLVEMESERQKFNDERKAWLAEKTELEAQASAAKGVKTVAGIDVDEVLDDPFAFFGQHGADEEKVFELAQNIFFLKFPDKAPADFDMKRTKRQMERQLKKLEDKTGDVEKRVEESITQRQQTEYNNRITAEFKAAAEAITVDGDDLPYTRAFFDKDSEDYRGALINTAGNVARELKRVPTTKEVAEALEKWLGARYERYKPKQANAKIEGDLNKVAGKSVTLSNDDVQVERRAPMTAEERYKRALGVLEGKTIIEPVPTKKG